MHKQPFAEKRILLKMNTMKLRTFGLIIGMLFFLSNCTDDDSSQEAPSNGNDVTIEIVNIDQDVLYGNGQEGIAQSNMVITNNSDWTTLLSQMDSVNNTTDDFTETDIDFDAFIVIAVFLEIKGSGWEVQIDSVVENDSQILISVTDTAFDNAVISQPFHIIKIPVTDKQIQFDI